MSLQPGFHLNHHKADVTGELVVMNRRPFSLGGFVLNDSYIVAEIVSLEALTAIGVRVKKSSVVG